MSLLSGLIFKSPVQILCTALGRYFARCVSASNGSPFLHAVSKSTIRYSGFCGMYSTHQIFMPKNRSQSCTNSNVSSRSLPVLANATTVSSSTKPFSSMIESSIADERPPEKLINFPFIVQNIVWLTPLSRPCFLHSCTAGKRQLATIENRRIINKLYSCFHVPHCPAAGEGSQILVPECSGDMPISKPKRVYYFPVVSGCAFRHEAEQRICPATLAGQFFEIGGAWSGAVAAEKVIFHKPLSLPRGRNRAFSLHRQTHLPH